MALQSGERNVGQTELPDKLFFKIGEVAQLVGVKPHVLRYWESEFPNLRPLKTRGAHRMYRRRDVELAVVLRRLLHEERLTVAGAKKRLRELGQTTVKSEPDPSATREVEQRAAFIQLRRHLSDLLLALDRIGHDEPTDVAEAKATVTSATSSAVPVQAKKTSPGEQIASCPDGRRV